jgi:hypothetical protein
LLFNRPQGLDCTQPRLGSGNSSTLRTLTIRLIRRKLVLFLLPFLHRPHNLPPRQPYLYYQRYLRRIRPAVLRWCMSMREPSDVVGIHASFRPRTASSSRNTGPKISTASTNVQLRRMVKSWGTTGARLRSDTLSKRHTLARARGGGYTAAAQVIVARLAVCATRTAPDGSALASVPTKPAGSSYT